ncbi:hypothetical protein CAPTEDRAFT_214866 [Capitella teleta]|uniref:Uncharacterized protein n=1 Tax=Capitella teleta TaxID=283909 RepID=R7U6P7_CAPTE|nr:hypothetical protein CAPTEDRAFT_214866 [Capitella teleta]|eukprot:ELU01669.1 hypothetical protein CAPTEDRAFT_214866 [Capitella teleta]
MDEYWINEDDDKEPDSDDDCDWDLELLKPPTVTTLGLLSQATRTEGVKIKTWMMDYLRDCQHSSNARSDSDENDNGMPPPFPPPPPPLPLHPTPPPPLPQENQI